MYDEDIDGWNAMLLALPDSMLRTALEGYFEDTDDPQTAIDALFDNLHDMTKEDAVDAMFHILASVIAHRSTP